LAWLVANTEGDVDEAIRCSKKSLELRPGSASYLDTLGRCYFAKGDLEKAVECQLQAVALEPQMKQMAKQLELFQAALEKSRRGSS
jgi:tetratricopeptide (TPR) repeat protein